MTTSNKSSQDTSRLDNFYTNEDHATVPKEYFKEAINILKAQTSDFNPEMLVDVGCACGDFINYASKQFNFPAYAGLDKFPEMVNEASKRLPHFEFATSDLNVSPSLFDNPLRERGPKIITMLGVLSIFSSKNWIKNFSSLLNNDGIGLIFGMVNPYPYDVFIRLVNQSGENEYGWNSWSLETLKKEFSELGYDLSYTPWNTPINIDHNENDPLRSWTIQKSDGDRLTVNGSRMIHDYAFLVVKPR